MCPPAWPRQPDHNSPRQLGGPRARAAPHPVLPCPPAEGVGESLALWLGLNTDWEAWTSLGLTTCWLCNPGQIHSPLWTPLVCSALWGFELQLLIPTLAITTTAAVRSKRENSLVLQGLRLHASVARGPGLIPGQGTKTPKAVWSCQKKSIAETGHESTLEFVEFLKEGAVSGSHRGKPA